MEKRISYSEFQSVKSVFKSCEPMIAKRNKLRTKIEKLAIEYKNCEEYISTLEAGIVKIIGLPVDKLVKKVVEPGVDVNGQPKKTTKYLPTDIVSYDEKKKQYVITLPDMETPVESENKEMATAETKEEEPKEDAPHEVPQNLMGFPSVESEEDVPDTAPTSIFE